MYNDFIFVLFGFIDFSLCVLPTTIGSESTNCDDPYQWYTMHRQIKFVMIPHGSSSAPAYSLWTPTPSPSLSLSPFTLHPSLIYPSLCLRCVSAAGGGVGASGHTFLPHLTAFLLLHRRHASGSACWGAAAALRGTQETTQGQNLQVKPIWGQMLLLC